mgnify:CR=1 FL=1
MRKINKILLAFTLGLIMFSANSFAQSYNHVIKANPIGLAFGNFNLTYEKVLNHNSSVLFSGSYMYKMFGEDVSAAGLGAGYRWYVTSKKTDVPSGFWITPQAAIGFGKSDETSITTFSVGAEVGYQWAMKSGFTVDLGIGPSYTVIAGDNTLETTSGILPTLTLAIGYAF